MVAEIAVENVVDAVPLVVVRTHPDVAVVTTLPVRTTETAGTATTTDETATELIAHVAPMIGKPIFRGQHETQAYASCIEIAITRMNVMTFENLVPMEMTGKVNLHFQYATTRSKYSNSSDTHQLPWILLHQRMMNWTPPSKQALLRMRLAHGRKKFIVSFGC